jgi:hypothetical protein
VPALVELQRDFARAMTTGDGTALGRYCRGGFDADARLAIHLRHYAASLATALCDKFPATVWLAGAAAVRDAAVAYARRHPPLQPCIAEYGREFPPFLARQACAGRLPYLEPFARLEWAVGRASIAVDSRPLRWAELADVGAERIVDASLALQPGVHYVRADWRIEELLQTYLAGAAPDAFLLAAELTPIEVHGARGTFRLTRLDAATCAFREALAAAQTIGAAAEAALTLDAAFDAGNALRSVVAAGLVTGCTIPRQEAISA